MKQVSALLATVLAVVAFCAAVVADDPAPEWGWSFMTNLGGAVNLTIPVQGDAKLLTYIDETYAADMVERVVIQIHGHGRDVWNYQQHTANARKAAVDTMQLDPRTVLSIAPEFFGIGDLHHGAITPADNYLCWYGDDWSGGSSNVEDCTPGVTKVSSFAAMDALLAWITSSGRFPKLNTIVISGHSLGAQYAHRYASLAAPAAVSPAGGVEVHYWIGNSASYLYLSNARPASTAQIVACPEFDDYKYGVQKINDVLSGYPGINRAPSLADVWRAYSSRNVHLALGLADAGSGNLGCEGLLQGKSHLDRGQGYMAYLDSFLGGLPQSHTIDYLPGITHDAARMLSADVSLRRLFFDRHASQQPSQAPPDGPNNNAKPSFSTPGGPVAGKGDHRLNLAGQALVPVSAPSSSASAGNASSMANAATKGKAAQSSAVHVLPSLLLAALCSIAAFALTA